MVKLLLVGLQFLDWHEPQGKLLGQRRPRIVLRDPENGVDSSRGLPDAPPGHRADLLVHRRVLQYEPQTFVPGSDQPDAVRGEELNNLIPCQ